MASGGGIGWDTALTGEAQDGGASPLIERTRDVKVDVNDYSRFKNVGDSDDEADKKSSSPSTAAVAPAAESCRNCHKPGAKLKCSICKKAAYCARTCQASDWTFHKRTCKKPTPPKKDTPPPRKPAAATTSTPAAKTTPSTSSTTTTTTSSSSSSSAKKTSTKSTEVVVDEPDLPTDMRGYKNGMPYFHRELTEEEQKLIGDIAPKKVEVAPATAAPLEHQGSAWNSAGTFEEKLYTKWAEQKWSDVFSDATFSEGGLQAKLSAPEKITGDASICVVRGKKRYLFDFNFTLPFEISTSGGGKYTGNYTMNDISNDEDFEISYRLTKKPANASELAAIQAFVAKRNSGLQKEVVRIIGEFTKEFQNQ